MLKTKVNTVKIEWFEQPVQVSFYNFDDDNWMNGIGYRNEIICGCCGAVIPLEDLYDAEMLAIEPQPVRTLSDWVDFSDYIGE